MVQLIISFLRLLKLKKVHFIIAVCLFVSIHINHNFPLLKAHFAFNKSTSERIHRLLNHGEHKRAKGLIQSHFSKHNFYIPIENIMLESELAASSEMYREIKHWLKENCGNSFFYVWTPVKISLPLIGFTVYDLCWRPG